MVDDPGDIQAQIDALRECAKAHRADTDVDRAGIDQLQKAGRVDRSDIDRLQVGAEGGPSPDR